MDKNNFIYFISNRTWNILNITRANTVNARVKWDLSIIVMKQLKTSILTIEGGLCVHTHTHTHTHMVFSQNKEKPLNE